MKISKLKAALTAVAKKHDFTEHDTAALLKTAKVGRDAVSHSGSRCAAYFATEDTIAGAYYGDAPSLWWQLQEDVNAALPGFFIEPKNSVEFCIFPS